MAKCYYVAKGIDGRTHGRITEDDQGFTHAAIVRGSAVLVTFGTSSRAAQANLGRLKANPHDIVPCKQVVEREYRVAMGLPIN